MYLIFRIYKIILVFSSFQCIASNKNATQARTELRSFVHSTINLGLERVKKECGSASLNLPETISLINFHSDLHEEFAHVEKCEVISEKESKQVDVEYEPTTIEAIKTFKMGFEFQTQPLCPWAQGIKKLKTEPIFRVKKKKRTLWDLTIDWNCLEFITTPFCNSESNLLKECMESMELSLDVLTNLNNANNLNNENNFLTIPLAN